MDSDGQEWRIDRLEVGGRLLIQPFYYFQLRVRGGMEVDIHTYRVSHSHTKYSHIPDI